jgi:putative transposase
MSRPPRLREFSYRGRHSYFLTFCTHQRRQTFRDPEIVGMVLQQFRRTAGRYGFELSAYCFMPDHVHLLPKGIRDDSDLRGFVKSAKQSSGQLYAHRRKEPLWQESYYDHVVRPEESLLHVARYIIENPVRAGLVSSPLAYPHLGSDVWSIGEVLAAF